MIKLLDLKSKTMRLDLNAFNWMFPNYYDYKTPMWSAWSEKDNDLILEVAIPGYTENDFTLKFEDGKLNLGINKDGELLHYSIVGRFYEPKYKLEDTKATYKSGILKITIPQAQKKMKQIPIKVS